MSITLSEEFLLLALEDAGGEFSHIPETSLSCGLAGAALMDLALRGRIDSDLERVWVVDPSPTDSETLNHILAQIAAEPVHHPASFWIRRLMPQGMKLRSEALAKLCERGILRPAHAAFMWVARTRYPVEHDATRQDVKRRILALLFNEEIPAFTEISLIAIADACGIFQRILDVKTLAEVTPRIRQIRALDLIGGEIARTAEVANHEIRAAERRTVAAGLAGNVMEWYDFGIYGFFAAVIGKAFFPLENPTASLLASFGVFAVGFVGRPLGALFFGHVGDSHGRKKALIISVLMMAVPTALMALLPTHAQIGIVAPLLLVLLRFAQGLAVGGEYTTSMVLLVEEAQQTRRGLVGSFAPFGAVGGMLLGSIVGATITGALSPEQVDQWGWRVAFLIGLLIGIVVIVVRRQLPPDETITAIEAARRSPIATAFSAHRLTIVMIIGVVIVQSTAFYLNFVYLTTWLSSYTALPRATILLINGFALFVMLCALPVSGKLSDRIGRQVQIVIGTILLASLAWPLLRVIGHGSVPAVLLGQSAMALLVAAIGGPLTAFMVEAIPKHVRCTALSVGYNVAQAVFGGTVPMVAVFLIAKTDYPFAPAFYLALVAVISTIAVSRLRSRAGEDEAAARGG